MRAVVLLTPDVSVLVTRNGKGRRFSCLYISSAIGIIKSIAAMPLSSVEVLVAISISRITIWQGRLLVSPVVWTVTHLNMLACPSILIMSTTLSSRKTML